MDRDTVVRLALEASRSKYARLSGVGIDDLMRFATLIANETLERAAIATLDEAVDESVSTEDQAYNTALLHAAAAIRALKE